LITSVINFLPFTDLYRRTTLLIYIDKFDIVQVKL